MGIKLQAPEDCGGFSYQGNEVKIGKDGIVDLEGATADLIATMQSHGFTIIKDAAPATDAKKARRAAE